MTIPTLDQPIQQLIKQLDRQLGKGTLMRLGDAKHLQIATLSTAIPDLDAGFGWRLRFWQWLGWNIPLISGAVGIY